LAFLVCREVAIAVVGFVSQASYPPSAFAKASDFACATADKSEDRTPDKSQDKQDKALKI
jgi:hypothetical protein